MWNLLQIAYLTNIVILVPVLVAMFRDDSTTTLSVFQGKVQNSDGLRLLVASLWSAILLTSIAGIFQPGTFTAILIMQVIYKLIYLLVYVAPRAILYGRRSVPTGLTASFVIIVIAWPVIIAFSRAY